jgi:hypothetical protein
VVPYRDRFEQLLNSGQDFQIRLSWVALGDMGRGDYMIAKGKMPPLTFRPAVMGSSFRSLLRALNSNLRDNLRFARFEASGISLERLLRVQLVAVGEEQIRTVFGNVIPPAPIALGGQHVQLPMEIESKKCCVNIQNSDYYCFPLCVI